ncbi:hypothetical protein [Microcystis aeruginosa]|uniref:hypothetical protein n=1 Tax=Microcystis aeruginosa TaxID=1126 RepID=UPI001305308B|nr:hypothetical protein [Microcystis aeruginosa]
MPLTGKRVWGVGCGVWGVGKETSFICGGENFFIGTDLKEAVGRGQEGKVPFWGVSRR